MKKTLTAALAATALLGGGAVLMHSHGSTVAQAQAGAKATVDAAIAAGQVGERIDGYLAVVSDAPANVRAAVDEINIGRKAAYTRLAREQNVKTEVVARLTGEKQIAKAAPGTFVMRDDGVWGKK